MAINFDAQTGLSADDTETIRAQVVAAWQSVFNDEDATLNTEPESPAGQIIDSIVALITGKDSEFLAIANQFNPKTASGRFQDMLALIYFITRKTAEPTVVTCQCMGLQNTVIPQGAIIQNSDGYRLTSNGEAVIPASGTVDVEFSLEETGPIAIGANTCTTIVTVIPGWDTVNNAVAGVLGRNEESRAEFEARRYASVANNAHGSVAAVYGTLANINGVLDLQVLENRGDTPIVEWGVTIPGHSVAVCIYGGADDDIAEGIYNKLGNGCGTTGGTTVTYTTEAGAVYEYEILRPTPQNVKVQVTIRETERTPATIESDLKTAIVNDFYGNDPNSENTRVGLAQNLYASRFSVAAIKTAGVVDLLSIQVALGDGVLGNMIVIPGNVEPVLTAENVTVVIQEEETG